MTRPPYLRRSAPLIFHRRMKSAASSARSRRSSATATPAVGDQPFGAGDFALDRRTRLRREIAGDEFALQRIVPGGSFGAVAGPCCRGRPDMSGHFGVRHG